MSDASVPVGFLDDGDDRALAAEYVLGLLDPGELRAVEARLGVEPELRRLVALWSEELVSLADGVAPVAPPPRLEAEIVRRLFPEEPRRPWFRRGPGLAALLGGLAAALLVLWLVVPGLFWRSPLAPDFTATAAAEDQSLVLTASLEAEDEFLDVVLRAGAPPPGRVLELWLLPDGGAGAPESLGVLPAGVVAVELPVRDDLRDDMPDGVLAVSDEPPGGSPEDTPTGAVLATGPIVVL